MKERREGRVATVSGLALLAGGTAMAASVGGDHRTLSATLLLGTLTLGLGHSLIEEIKRQARRGSSSWTRTDTTNAVLLGVWTELALLMTVVLLDTTPTRAVGLALATAYAAACGYFVTERRRAIAARTSTVALEPSAALPEPSAVPPESSAARPEPSAARQGPEELAAAPLRRHSGYVGHAPTAGNFFADHAG